MTDIDLDKLNENMESLRLKLEPNQKIEEKVAEDFFHMECGTLHLGWAVDRYWIKVAREIMIPNLHKIYDALVAKGYSENQDFSWGDYDGSLYYIPNEKREIIVFTTQSTNFLFILGDIYDGKKSDTLHIRKFWEPYKAGDIWGEDKMLGDIHKIIDSVETLEKFADDFSQYPQRPSLELYRKIDFDLNNYQREPRFYGDCRDHGYIISLGKYRDHDLRTMYTSHYLDILATCYIGVMAEDLEIDPINLKGYP